MKTPTLEELLPKAKQLANENDHVSSAFFQRRLKIGYSLAAGLRDRLETEGIIEPYNGKTTLRKVLRRDFKHTILHPFNNLLKLIRVSP